MINNGGGGTNVAAADKAASAASSQISREIRKTNNNNNNIIVADCGISIDTTTNFLADIPQQDSGSNQSGSDSGLGYANSFSSDNSSITNATTNTTILSTDQVLAKSSNSNSSIITPSTKNNNNESSVVNRHNSNLASSCTKIPHPIDATNEFVVDFTDESSRKEPDRANNKRTIFKSKDNNSIALPELVLSSNPLSTELATPSPPHQQSAVQAPVLKSLLKKPSSRLNSTSNSVLKPTKHKRNVSFNQTVIVFCEEIGAPTSPDVHEQSDPPLDYQDPIRTTFDPPDDYCEHKVGGEMKAAASVDVESSLVAGRDNTAGFNHRESLGLDVASDLTDDQLIGLLENDTLLETFKLNCEDVSEDDFPINHLNSNHGYLCNDAISDYDSDSESSFCFENNENSGILNAQVSTANNKPKSIALSVANSHQVRRHRTGSGSALNSARHSAVDRCSNYETSSTEKQTIQPITKSNIQRSMPARMRVSTVDSHTKRQSNRHDDQQQDSLGKLKLEACQNNLRGCENESYSTSLKSVQPERNDTRIPPMLIKQTNLEPFSLSKSVIVSNNFPDRCMGTTQLANANKNSIPGSKVVVAKESSAHELVDQIHNDHTRTREIALPPAQQNLNQGIRSLQQLPASVVSESNAQGCHICKVIQSSKTKQPEIELIKASLGDELSRQKLTDNSIHQKCDTIENLKYQPTLDIASNQPAVFNQSCVSCRDVSKQQQQTQQSSLQDGMPVQNPMSIAQQHITRPPTYQLVYVVDSKGNRIRALSMIRTAPRNTIPSSVGGISACSDRRVFVAHNGVRFPNPVSVAGQIVNLTNSHQQLQSHLQWNPQNSLVGNNPQQYRVVGAIQAQNPQLQQNQCAQNPSSNIFRPPTFVSTIQKVVPMGKPRPHTVYYVHQPLNSQNICQSVDSAGSNYRSFPDPHEIRRLDGLRGPTTAINLSNKIEPNDQTSRNIINSNNQRQFGDITREQEQVSNSTSRDETDDPTFGFSKRPSVKVVATNCNILSNNFSTLNNRSRIDGHNHSESSHLSAHPNNLVAIHRLPSQTSGNIRPVPVVVMRSQTLDRRHLIQQSQQQPMKENIPSTSSMSNIHGSYINLPTNKLSINSNQQPRISGDPLTDPKQDNLKSKDVRSSELENSRLDGNKNVILNDGTAPLAATAQVRQTSAAGGNDLTTDRNNRRTQVESEVVYSMNI